MAITDRLDRRRTLGVEHDGMVFLPVAIYPKQCDAALNDGLDVFEPATATVLPADVQDADERDFHETNAIALYKNNNYKVHMCIEITSETLRTTGSVFNAGAGPNLVCRPSIRSNGPIASTISTTCLSNHPRAILSASLEKLFSFSSWTTYTCMSTFVS